MVNCLVTTLSPPGSGTHLVDRVRDEYEYPDVEEIDPYDPGTFGFIEAGVVLGAHGVDGVIKVRATSEIGEEALSYPGLRHVKVREC